MDHIRVMDSDMYMKLMQEVQKHDLIYNIHSANDKQRDQREVVWAHISSVLALDVYQCKREWKNLRDTYNRFKREEMNASDCVAVIHKKWKFYDSMSFLDNAPIARSTIKNTVEEELLSTPHTAQSTFNNTNEEELLSTPYTAQSTINNTVKEEILSTPYTAQSTINNTDEEELLSTSYTAQSTFIYSDEEELLSAPQTPTNFPMSNSSSDEELDKLTTALEDFLHSASAAIKRIENRLTYTNSLSHWSIFLNGLKGMVEDSDMTREEIHDLEDKVLALVSRTIEKSTKTDTTARNN